MFRRMLLATTAVSLSVAAAAQQNPSPSDDITKMACQSYKRSLVNMLETTSNGLSEETLRELDQPPLNAHLRQQTTRDILKSVIESESNPQMRQVITKASNAYIRSQSVDSFERGLADLVPICVQVRSEANRQQRQDFSQGQQPNSAPAPNTNDGNARQDEGQQSTLPSTDSYL